MDMINHGSARRSEKACYEEMALEVHQAIKELAGEKAALIGRDFTFKKMMIELNVDYTFF